MDKNIPAERTLPSMLPARLHAYAATYAAGDAGLMFFLLRMTFWLGLVLILLPSGSAERAAPADTVNASEAISAASATVGDLRQFCGRQPDACTVGSHVATTLGYKAQAGAKMIYDFLTESLAPKGPDSIASAGARDGKPALSKASAEKGSQDTLVPADMTPAWHGPLPRKDPRHAV